MRRPALALMLLASFAAAAAPPPMSAAQVIDASAAGAVVTATCGKGGADMHRRNALNAARQMLQARGAVPKDLDARFMRVWAADSARMRALAPAQRRAVCARMEKQGVRFRR